MVRFFNVLWVLLIFAVCLDAMAQGNTFYVSAAGKDTNRGTSAEMAWKTIGKANKELQPGDIVYLLKGTYQETIQPIRSGQPGKYITYARYRSDEVIITGVRHGVDLADKAYIIIDGFSILNVGGAWVNFDPSGNHCIIRNCFMEEAGGYNGINMANAANYNKIINNVLKDKCTGDDPDTAVGGPNDLITCFNSAYNLFDGNKFYGGIHNGLNIQKRGQLTEYNIIRNNYFECRWHGSIDLYKGPGHTLIENNIIVDGGEDYAVNWCGTVKDRSMKRGRQRGIKAGAENSIIRGNVMINNGYGIELHGIKDENTNPQNNHIYNNTFFDNYNGLWMRDASAGDVKENKISNNILYKNKEYNLRMQLMQSENHDNSFFNNNIFNGENLKECNQPFDWQGNIAVSPGFVNEGSRDMHLAAGSPMIDAGTFLTVTTGAGSGKNIPVEDAYFFTDGWGLIEGDEIQLEGQQNKARIIKIDYNSNILTVNQDLAWQKGQGVSLPYSGKAPDMGAYELQTQDGPRGDVPTTPLNLKINNITGSSAALSWNDNSNKETGFTIERKAESDRDLVAVFTTLKNVTAYTDRGLTDGTPYSYRVKLENNDAKPTYSNIVKITTLLPSNTPPQAVIKADKKTGDFPLTVNFNATDSKDPDGEIVAYAWSFGDGKIGNGKIVNHTYGEKGNFTAKLTVTDNKGGKSSETIVITVGQPGNNLPVAEFSIDKQEGTVPLTVSLNATASTDSDGTVEKYHWDFGDGGIGYGRLITYTFENKGDFTVTLKAIDNLGDYAKKSMIIKVSQPGQPGNSNNPPVAKFSADKQEGTVPLTVNFNATASTDSDGTVKKYHWDFGDGGIGYGRIITYTFEKKGDFTVKLKAIDDDGNVNFTEQIIQVKVPGQTEGKTYFVSASKGNDNNSGLTEKAPWKTLDKVNSKTFFPGDVILFRKGDTWKENLVINNSGSPSAEIQISAYGKGNYPKFAPGNAADVIRIINTNYVTIANIHVIAAPDKRGIRVAGDAKYVKIKDCKIEGHARGTSSQGIVFSAFNAGKYPTHPSIVHCEVFNFKEGISGHAGLHEGGLIADNKIYASGKTGIDLITAVSGNYEGLLIRNNELTGWRNHAVDLYEGSNIVVEYNQIHHPADALTNNENGIGIRAGGADPSKSMGNIIRFNSIHHLNVAGSGKFDAINSSFSRNGKIYGNLIYTVRGNAIAINSSGPDGWEIYNNTAVDAGKCGIYAGNDIKQLSLSNNILGGRKYDIQINDPSSSAVGQNNLLLNYAKQKNPVGGRGAYKTVRDINIGSVNFRGSKVFINDANENFSLAPGSPAIDAGIVITGYRTDINGKPVQGKPDVGAIEFQENLIQVQEDEATDTDAIAARLLEKEISVNQKPEVNILAGERAVSFPLDISATDDGRSTAFKEEKTVVTNATSKIIASKAFSPNGDGIDDFWIIKNIDLIENCQLRIFNRAGKNVFEAAPYQNNWDATLNGSPLPSKDYYYILNCKDTGTQSGGIRVIR